MDDDFDPHYKWLGIPPEEQPPDHYRLLGMPLFTNDLDVIENLAEQRIRHVRTFQIGEHAAFAHEVLNEIAAARACLLDIEQKLAYDLHLRSEIAAKKFDRIVRDSRASKRVRYSGESRNSRSEIASPTIVIRHSPFSRHQGPMRRKRDQHPETRKLVGSIFGMLVCFALGYLIIAWAVPEADFLDLMPPQESEPVSP